jgi:hypothetical protein
MSSLKTSILTAIISIAVSLPAAALDLGARDVLVPVVGRVAGANGSQWRTDLVITNVTRPTAPTMVFVQFHSNDGSTRWEGIPLDVHQSIVLNDVIRSRFDRENDFGYIRVTTSNPTAKVAARARIYNNANPQGEFGQSVSALPTDALMRDHYVPALSGVDGNRTNLGLTNPWKTPVKALLELFGRDGVLLAEKLVTVENERVLQMNDVFGFFGAPPSEGAMVKVTAMAPLYAWASVVRNDSGDSTFIEGTGLAIGNELLVPTLCSSPAPVNLARPGSESAGNWIVIYQPGTDATATTQQLASRLGFTATFIYQAGFPGFSASLTQTQISFIRCDTSVKLIEENIIVPLP